MSTPETPAHAASNGFNDALTFLNEVKRVFADQPEKYSRLLGYLTDFRNKTVSVPVLTERITALFDGHPHLVTMFTRFVPAQSADASRAVVPQSNL